MRTCCWILKTATPGVDAVYCGKPCSYKMVDDGGEPGAPKVRKYNHLCEEHQRKQDTLPDDDWADDTMGAKKDTVK